MVALLPGMFVNLSLDFTIARRFAIMPGFTAFNSFKFGSSLANYDYVVAQNGVSKSYPWQYYYDQQGGTPYVTVAYKPWDLSFNYVPAGSSGLSLYSLTFAKKF